MKYVKLFEQHVNEDSKKETIMTFKTEDGKEVKVEDETGTGMADEPCTFVHITLDGKIVKLDDLELKIELDEYNAIKAHLKEVGDENYTNALAWVQ